MTIKVNSPLSIDNPQEGILYWFIFGVGLLWTIYLMVNSAGVYLQDEIGHFLIAKDAWKYPELMLDVWGRTLNTILYMIPARWGLTAARVLSLMMAVLTVWLTTKVAAISGVERLYLIPFLLWFQPWFNDFSYHAITEVPFSLFLILAVILWLSGREKPAAIVFGLLPLIRHEGIALAAIFGLYMFFQRKWFTATLTVLPLAVYNVTYFAAFKDWPFTIFLDTKPTEHYGHGSWFHFLPRIVYRAGLPITFLALIGSIAVWNHRRRFLYLVWYLVYFLVHTVIYRFGLFASGGYSIFLLPLAPAMGIMAALGGEVLLNYFKTFSANQGTFQRRLSQILIPAAAMSVLVLGFSSRPYSLDEEGLAMQEAAQWIRENTPTDKPLVTTHVWFLYYYDLPWIDTTRLNLAGDLEKSPDGSLVLWDRHYSELGGIHLAYLSDTLNGWHKLADFRNGVAILFQKINRRD